MIPQDYLPTYICRLVEVSLQAAIFASSEQQWGYYYYNLIVVALYVTLKGPCSQD
jgi:uncharacterized membrane protein